mmetsp:Transcript_17093/g.37393  ORF Transcript_17093/g.37393 Transcript_17093/m.37393 type:complete len:218 (+) Transcript_17093:60-713(+)
MLHILSVVSLFWRQRDDRGRPATVAASIDLYLFAPSSNSSSSSSATTTPTTDLDGIDPSGSSCLTKSAVNLPTTFSLLTSSPVRTTPTISAETDFPALPIICSASMNPLYITVFAVGVSPVVPVVLLISLGSFTFHLGLSCMLPRASRDGLVIHRPEDDLDLGAVAVPPSSPPAPPSSSPPPPLHMYSTVTVPLLVSLTNPLKVASDLQVRGESLPK